MMAIFDAAQSRENRDAGIEQVSNSNAVWLSAAKQMLHKLAKDRDGQEVTGEDVRAILTEIGMTPEHPNAWGALINWMVKRNVLIPTHRYTSMKDPRSHARKTQIYKLNGFFPEEK
jgi:hypothetical protein